MRVLFVGDIYMDMGRLAFQKYFEQVKRQTKAQFVIVNGENIATGNGITETIYKELMSQGVNIVTLGNHAYTQRDSIDLLEKGNICRPANYGVGAKGKEYVTLSYNGKKITVINLLGRVFMKDQIDNPFTKMDTLLAQIDSDYIIVDFHAEATSEKYALANYLDGRVSAMVGTHTHVPTADSIVFPKGMLYLSDVGMTGTKYGIIGGEIKQGIRKFLSGVPERVNPENSGPLQFNAVLLDLEQRKIERINIYE
ncbi:MAG: TIGR00282 family metallophosphoesterase [Candidatus Izemoplasmatales bacterium]|nr:TIGR00282 family metallophosphoesterase [bacterium]MDZ4197636.1 TIGR00282 family metallophosphoesterase [Candidatus Izemoplasmatales bacterium]